MNDQNKKDTKEFLDICAKILPLKDGSQRAICAFDETPDEADYDFLGIDTLDLYNLAWFALLNSSDELGDEAQEMLKKFNSVLPSFCPKSVQ